ncbi:unnamed protein product [Arctia plantaginis]|uniref:PHD-type domain-containing protein n=1 Tax=Arctia plantaginis TaxID=874455 RepID=A0A8S1B348_ARCPL|nr:unnamed protein product [Arctia plantaginis]
MNSNCKKCNDKVQDGAQCSRCKLVYHYYCVALSEVGWRRLGSERQASWLCPNCKSNAQLNSPRNTTHCKPIEETKAESTSLENIEAMLASLSGLPVLVEKLRNEVSELNARFSSQVIEELNTRLDDIEAKLSSVESLKIEQNKLITKLNTHEDRFIKLDKELKQQIVETTDLHKKMKLLEKEYNRSQQQNRFLNVEIVGVPEKSGENLVQLLLQIATFVNANINADDIEFTTRVQPHHSHPGRPRRIIAKLKTRRAKDSIIINFRKLNKDKGITSKDLGYDGNSNKVFINEHLTIANKILLNNCRQRARELNVKFVWVKNCSIYMRNNETSPPVEITAEEDIQKFSS